MLSSRSRPGSSSTNKIRPRVCSWGMGLLWIGATFTFPDRSFDVRYRVQFCAGLVELLAQLPVLVERGLQSLRILVVALRRGDLRRFLEPRRFGIENQPSFDVFQLDEREHTLFGQQRVVLRERLVQEALSFERIARRVAGRRERE